VGRPMMHNEKPGEVGLLLGWNFSLRHKAMRHYANVGMLITPPIPTNA
jgi:hypothetical protein